MPGDAISSAACQGPIKGGINTEEILALFQTAPATQGIELMSEQIAGKAGSQIKLGGGTELHLGRAGV